MEVKLFKTGNDFLLKDVNGETLAITSGTIKGRMSSLKNCQAIERGYDLDELADKNVSDIHEANTDFMFKDIYREYFKEGFEKALELMGDKKYSEEDVKNIFAKTLENAPSTESHTRMISDVEYRHSAMDELYDRITKSLQQTEWDVEIEMEYIGECNGNNDNGCFQNSSGHNCGCFERKPKLDENGCLILKKI